jgi:hypothetical protein
LDVIITLVRIETNKRGKHPDCDLVNYILFNFFTNNLRRVNINKILVLLDNVEIFLMSHVSTISYILGLIFGVLSMIVFVNFSLIYSALTLLAGFIVFELYKNIFAGEPDFVMNFDKEEIQDGDDFSKMIKKVFEEAEKREDD